MKSRRTIIFLAARTFNPNICAAQTTFVTLLSKASLEGNPLGKDRLRLLAWLVYAVDRQRAHLRQNALSSTIMNSLSRTLDYYTRNCILKGLSSEKNDALRFVQVGGNDGKIADPLFPFHSKLPWSGSIVEPVPFYFSRLTERNSGNPRIQLINKALSDRNGSLEIFFLSPEHEDSYRDWHRGLASVDPSHVLKHGVAQEHLASVQVESITPSQLLESIVQHSYDLLVIDTEGHEFPILTSWPYMAHPPRLTIFEAWHMPGEKREELRRWAASMGREIYFTSEDGYVVDCSDYLLCSLLENMQEFAERARSGSI